MPKKRLDYLDMAKGVGIFLVVLGHIEYLRESAMRFIFSFHMPLFFMIGGILTFEKMDTNFRPRDSIKKRARGTLVPYASFSIILLTMRVFEYFVQPERITGRELLRQIVDSVTGYGLHTLWFLPVYFGAGSLFFLLCRHFQNKTYCEWKISGIILILTFLAFGLIYGFRLDQYPVAEGSLLVSAGMNVLIVLLRILIVLPFFLLGWHYGKAGAFPKKKGWLLGTGILLFALGAILSQYVSILDLHYLYIYPIHYVAAAASCIGLLDILQVMPVSRVLSYLGQNSLIIMCTHAPLYVLYYVSLGMFFVRKLIPMADPVLYAAIALVTCAAEVPIIWFFNRHLKYLLGRKV